MRLFIGINFEEYTKDKIQDIVTDFKCSSLKGKFVSKEHMHLTFEFLGDVSLDKVEIIKEAMDKIPTKPFSLQLSKIGHFKHSEGNIYWIGIKENESLLKIQSQLHNILIEQGFELEDREYKPHLTIGRKVKMEETYDVDDQSKIINGISINVDKIDLMKSEHIKGNLVHSIIYSRDL